MKRIFPIALFLIMVMALATVVTADVPKVLNYQGRLTDTSGAALDGPYNMVFTIYDQVEDGTGLWQELHIDIYETEVIVSDGLFAVVLGEDSTIHNGVFDGSDRWLGIRIGSDSEIVPRVKLTSAAFSFISGHAGTADTTGYAASIADNSVDSTKVEDGSIGFVDIAQNGADSGQTMMWDGATWVAADGETGSSNWSVTDSVLYTNNYWGIARGGAGNVIYGVNGYTMVNLGVNCTTGTGGENRTHCTVSGGEYNSASHIFSTVSGGDHNIASGGYSTVGGGEHNTASAHKSTIGGGTDNTASDYWSTVAGGENNTAGGWTSTIAGGFNNTATGDFSTVGGGIGNQATGDTSTVGGGVGNIASGALSTVGGGWHNGATQGGATVAGGEGNGATGLMSAVGGGGSNGARGQFTTVGGGAGNEAETDYSWIGGGYGNTTKGYAATVPGGVSNTAAGDYSFACGSKATALHEGSFVWADASGAELESTAANQFLVRAAGGTKIYSNADLTAGVTMHAGASAWAINSDRNLKENFEPVEAGALLESISRMPIGTWNYKSQDASIRHMGPMAQDFQQAFALGEDDKHISTVDADGVALAAVQVLLEKIKQLETRIAELEAQNR